MRIHWASIGLLAAILACGDSAADANGAGSKAPGAAPGATPGGTVPPGTAGTPNAPGSIPGSSLPGDPPGPHRVSDCKTLPPAGTWEQITPELPILPDQAPCPYGGAFVLDPQDYATMYLGTCNQGIWKSTNCGADWEHVNTGTKGDVLDSGRQWTFAIDPQDSKRMYTNSGYGAKSNGAFRSSNGGVDWEQIWPPSDAEQAKVVENNFVSHVRMDPKNHLHLLMSFHAKCTAPHTESCFVESLDGGTTFKVIDGRADWAGGEGQTLYFLDNDHTWLYASQTNGLWRTVDSGGSWTKVAGDQGHAAGQLYHSKAGPFYLPSSDGILRSADGTQWDVVPNSGSVMFGLTGNGTTMWASRGFPWDPSSNLYKPFWSSSETDGMTWTQIDSPELSNGEQLEYDSDHHLLYSQNGGAGFWRVVAR